MAFEESGNQSANYITAKKKEEENIANISAERKENNRRGENCSKTMAKILVAYCDQLAGEKIVSINEESLRKFKA